jgi:hypothetical protein
VKCDEGQPGCVRCEKFGRECDGYEPLKLPPKPKLKPNSNIPNLIPITPAAAACKSRVPITVQCSDATEEDYFRFFWAETAGTLSGGFDNPLWSETVLQACNDELCIFHCAIALGALDKSCRAKRSKAATTTSEDHHSYALRRYDIAIREFREVLQHRKDFLRTTLIASLLIFCFESFHGDLRQALNNIQGAVELLHDWLSSFKGLATLGHFSPAPEIIEDEIVSAYTRMNIHFLSWIDAPFPTSGKLLNFAPTGTFQMPQAFQSFAEAKIAFDHVTNHILMFLSGIKSIETKSPSRSGPTSTRGRNTTTEDPFVLTELRQWTKAFDPVLDRAGSQHRNQDFIGAMILRIHALTAEICLRSANFEDTKPHAYDAFLPEFCLMVSLCKDLVTHPGVVKSFVYNIGFVPCLFIVVTKCTDTLVRQDAVDILKTASPRREGVWDSLMVARIGEELIRLEEEERRTGQTKEKIEIHLACLNMRFDLPRPPRTLEDIELKRTRDGRGCLLDWAERSVDMNVVFGTLPAHGPIFKQSEAK